ncbi:transketolase [Paenibacillus peoriae]|uniref:transketolase n=1 Tax=Paenibacillus peoriae TaxID=59893 RepID=UPI002116F3C1|nr:transketolase [Paenibacillus peoriae]
MKERKEIIDRIEQMALRMRKHALQMAFSASSNGAHLGPGLSIVDIMATLYGAVMKYDRNNPLWEERDRFILSKGHGTLGYYTALAESGFFSIEELYTFEENGGFLPGQPVMNLEKGIECSSGSLGLGLSFAAGMALSAKKRGRSYQSYVLLGDGECNEGTIWEAAMSAAHFKLNNLIAIVDDNKMQSDGASKDVLDMQGFPNKWKSFGWETIEVDGHDIGAVYDALVNPNLSDKPRVIIANTIKGKGVSFMEGNIDWHHGQLTKLLFDEAMMELGGKAHA